MATISGMLSASGNALDVFQQALGVVQNNIDNSSTPGFAAQSLNLEAQPLDVTGGLTGGVAAAGLHNSRDQYAEEQVQVQTQTLGQYTAQAQATTTIQSLFGTSGASGVSGALSDLYQAFSAWSTTPSDATAQQAVIASAQDVASSIQGLQSSLSLNAQQLNTNIASTASQINTITAQIQAYNVERVSETTPDPGQDAQLYSSLDNLSQLTNFSTVTQADGAVTVMLGGGSPVVIGSQQYPISTASSSSGTQVLDSNGNDITSQITSGQLGGMLSVSNGVLGSILGSASQTGTLNQFTTTLADTVNQILESGTVSTAPGAAAGTALFTYDTANDAASTLEVNPAITASQLAPVDSSGNSNGNANQLAALENNPLTALGGTTLTQYFGQIASGVGQVNQTATDNQTSQQQVVAQATTLVNNASGVSLDSEAVNVLNFQRAYQAIAQVITEINNLSSSVMNLVQPDGNG
jgi:flagellar hook-associated protein 1 FlgK